MCNWKQIDVSAHGVDDCFGSASGIDSKLHRLQDPASLFDDVIVGSFSCRPPKIIVLTSVSNLPASRRLTISVRALSSLPSVSPVSKSFKCWGVRSSDSPEDPHGNVRKARLTSSGLT